MEHKFEKHINCDIPHCNICEGGLAVCTVCNCAEGSLATECPGYDCYKSHGDLIYKRKIDFRNGQWIPIPSTNNPITHR